MKIVIEIDTKLWPGQEPANGSQVGAVLRKMADRLEEWPGHNETRSGLVVAGNTKIGTFSACFDPCPKCLDRPGYDGLGLKCTNCKGLGRIR